MDDLINPEKCNGYLLNKLKVPGKFATPRFLKANTVFIIGQLMLIGK